MSTRPSHFVDDQKSSLREKKDADSMAYIAFVGHVSVVVAVTI